VGLALALFFLLLFALSEHIAFWVAYFIAATGSIALLGSLLVFALIAAAMVLTRNVDWYHVGGEESNAREVR
jgi:inner membrane protein involved in colicin E2 resistance